MKTTVAIAGCPTEEVLAPLRADPSVDLVDLDVPSDRAPLALADSHVPRVYCSVLRTVVANALAHRPERIFADVGEGKCDGMRLTAEVLASLGFDVVRVRNESRTSLGHPISVSSLPLREKVDRITAQLLTGKRAAPSAAPARAGFWGVPPTDFAILDLFPEGTHVFGWTRCLENGTPADLDLEKHVDSGLPTVFFAQSFCQKNVLARHLAALHNGLHVEAAERITRADRAKIEAFFEFNLNGG